MSRTGHQRKKPAPSLDVISQGELNALMGAYVAAAHIAYSLRRRLEGGAVIEDGRWALFRNPRYRHELGFWQEPGLWMDIAASADGAGIVIAENSREVGRGKDDWPLASRKFRNDHIERQQAMRASVEDAAAAGCCCFCQECVASWKRRMDASVEGRGAGEGE